MTLAFLLSVPFVSAVRGCKYCACVWVTVVWLGILLYPQCIFMPWVWAQLQSHVAITVVYCTSSTSVPTCVRKEVYRWAKPIVWVSTFAKSRSLQPLDFKHLKSIEWNAWNNLWSTKRPSTLGISQMNSSKYLVLTQSLSIPHLLLSTSIAANPRPAQDCNHAYASMGLHWHTTPNGCTELS